MPDLPEPSGGGPASDPGIPGSEGRVFFDAILHPHRSLGRGGFRVVMGLVVALNLVVAGVLTAHGAWPVVPFCGLDVLALWLAFRFNYRAARSYERVRLTEADLTVQQVPWKRPERRWRFHPYWLRVSHDEARTPVPRVTLSARGQSVGVGSFLSPEERADFARSLDDALRAWRRPPCPPAPTG